MTARARWALLSGLAATLLGGALAPGAQADHHAIVIRELYPGTAANPNTRNDAFVELQMYAAGQNNFAGGHHIDVYGPGNDATADDNVIAATPALNGGDQRTVLIGGADVVGRDRTNDIGNSIDPSGGALCFRSQTGFGTIDCVEWGSGNNTINEGTPVEPGGIDDGNSITRSIANGCESLLQSPLDDSNNSSIDFFETMPSPRNNATTPTETNCVLTVTVTGSGTVTGMGINCPGDCTQTYFNGETFDLTATPVAGGMFNGWTDCTNPAGNLCNMNMSESETAAADFAVVNPPPSNPGTPATPVTPVTPTITDPCAALRAQLKKAKTKKKKRKIRSQVRKLGC